MPQSIRRFLSSKAGATSIEYALIAVLISIAAIAGYSKFAGTVNHMYADTANKMDSTWKTN